MLLGHAHPEVQAAVDAAVARGTSYGTPTEPEVELAEEIVARTPVDRVRFVSSGTEATMSAIRLARGFTGRDVVVKFAGCYHGHVDALLASAGSGLATFAVPGTPGVPASSTALTLVLPYNDRAAVEQVFAEHGDRHRLPGHRGRPRQHGRGPARAGLQRVPRRDLRPPRRPVRQRRGDDRLPGLAPGSVGPRRRCRGLATRPDHLRQGDGRRLPGRGVRRSRRRDVDARARGSRLPGRHPLGEPDRHHRRAHHPAPGHRRRLRPPRPRPATRIKAAVVDALDACGRDPRRAVGGHDVLGVLHRGPGARLRPTPRAPTPRPTPPSSTPCSTQGVYLPPSAYEAWFLSSAHDDRAVQTVLDALPAAAAAAARAQEAAA